MKSRWGERLGLRHCEAFDCHQPVGTGDGEWRYPDAIRLADPARRDSRIEPRRVHTIEIERREGFSIESVDQA